MSRRLVRPPAIAVAPLLAVTFAACGGDDSSAPTTLATAAPPTAVATSPTTDAPVATTSAPEPTTATTGVDSAEPAGLLGDAVTNMSALGSYHAEAVLLIGEAQAAIGGDFGTEESEFTITQVDGTQVLVRVQGSTAEVSLDGGATYETDTSGSFFGLSQIITQAPATNLPDQGEVELVGDEEVDGEPTTHVRIAAGSPIDVWIGDDPQVGTVIRQLRAVANAPDIGDFDLSVVFSDFQAAA